MFILYSLMLDVSFQHVIILHISFIYLFWGINNETSLFVCYLTDILLYLCTCVSVCRCK